MKLRTAVIISVGLLVILGLANIRHFMGRGKSDTAKGTRLPSVQSLHDACHVRDLHCYIMGESDGSWYAGADAHDGAHWYVFSGSEDAVAKDLQEKLGHAPEYPGATVHEEVN